MSSLVACVNLKFNQLNRKMESSLDIPRERRLTFPHLGVHAHFSTKVLIDLRLGVGSAGDAI